MRCVTTALLVSALAALAPSIEAQAFQNIIVSPSFENFGAVKVGGREYASVTIQNVGDEDIQFLNVFPYGDSSQFYVSNFCGYLLRYSTCTIQVQFAPNRAGHFSLNMNVTGGTANATAYLSGEGI
jgi:hypothetical protein